jgi:DNA polymerase-3 subunit delta'
VNGSRSGPGLGPANEPVHFPGVRGHAAAQAALARAAARGKLHHGLLVVGPEGVGKATLARGLAAALHCAVRPGQGCGTCVACRRVLSGVHAGVEWIRPEGAGGLIKVETTRELGNRLQHAPFEGDHHVVILDPADALNDQAFNALLKALEEPRPGVYFVLLVTHAEAVLPTIQSRCLVVRLGPLPETDVQQIVDATIAAAEDADPPPAEARALAVRMSEGSPGVALQLCADPTLAAAVALTRRAIEAADAGSRAIFCGDKGPLWTAWAEATAGPQTGRPARERAACARVVDLWLLHLRESLRGGEGIPGLPRATIDPAVIVPRLDRLLALREGLARNPNARLALEHTLLEMTA